MRATRLRHAPLRGEVSQRRSRTTVQGRSSALAEAPISGVRFRLPDKGKPSARTGRKATGLSEPAGLPKDRATYGISGCGGPHNPNHDVRTGGSNAHAATDSALPQSLRCSASALLIPTATSSAGELRASMAPGREPSRRTPPSAAALTTAHARAAQECADADLAPVGGQRGRVRAAILCLHNQIRAERGLPALRENTAPAQGGRRPLVRHGLAPLLRAHRPRRRLDGRPDPRRPLHPAQRGLGAGREPRLGHGQPRHAARDRARLDELAGAQANIVKRAYREIGIGVVTGIPSGDSRGATYTADFGVVRR